MFKILLIEKDIFECKYLITYMNNIDINFKIYGIAYTLNETLELLSAEDFDLILLDSNPFDNTYNILFNFIKTNNLNKYKKSIIIFVDNKKDILNLKENYYIHSYLIKPFSKKDFTKNIINYFIKQNKEIVINKIKEELQKLHFKLSYKGTQYLISCIYHVLLLKDYFNFNLFKDIFPIVAKEYNKSIDCIYGSIKTAIKNMYFDCKEDILKDYFHYYEIEKSPKPKDVIYQIVENISI